MDVSIFKQTLVPDQSVVENATKIIEEASRNPQFIQFIFQLIPTQEVQQDPTLLNQICIYIGVLIRNHWKISFDIREEIYWNQQNQDEIAMTLLNLVFNVNHNIRQHFIAAFRTIILRSFPNVYQIMETLMNIASTKISNNNLDDFESFLQICYFWAKSCSERQKPNQAEFDAIDQFNLKIVTFLSTIMKSGINFQQFPNIFYYLSKIIYRLTVSILLNDFSQILVELILQLCSILTFNSTDEIILKIKYQIVKIIYMLNESFLKNKPSKNPLINNFSNIYKTQISPTISNYIYSMLSLPLTYVISGKALYIYYQFHSHNICDLNTVTPDFIINVLIKSAQIPFDEVTQTEINPEQYLETNLNFGIDIEKTLSPRNSCKYIISLISSHIPIDELYSILVTSPKDAYDFEAKIYLLLILIKEMKSITRSKIRKNKKKGKKPISTTHINISPDFITNVINILNNGTNNPLFLRVTLLWFLSTTLKKVDPKLGCYISLNIIQTSPYPIEVLSASKLFTSCIKHINKEEEQISININSLLPKLLDTSSIFTNNIPSLTIEYLCLNSTENLSSYAGQLISVLLNIAINHIQNVDNDPTMEGATQILYLIYDIISQLEDNDPIVLELANYIIPKVMEIFNEFPQNEVFPDLIDLMGEFSQKMSLVIPIMFEVLPSFLQLLANDRDLLFAARQITMFIYPLVVCDNSPILQNLEMLNSIIQLTQAMIEFGNSDEGSEECLSYPLFLASCIIQVTGENTLMIFLPLTFNVLNVQMSLAIRTTNIIETDPTIFVGALHVIAAGIRINEIQVISMLNNDLVQFLLKLISEKTLTTYREMTIGFIVLISLAKNGVPDAYLKAASLYKRTYILKLRENNVEVDDDEEDDTPPQLITLFPVPFDSINPFEYFMNISGAELRGLFEQLPIEIAEEIKEVNMNLSNGT